MNPGIESLPLRDIHMPDSVSWWPPALGWWLVIGILFTLVAVVLAVKWMKRRRQFNRIALAEFNQIIAHYNSHGNPQQLLQELSALMRRITISAFPERHAAGMTGDAWLRFLDELAMQATKNISAKFDSPLGQWLVSAPYQKRIVPPQQDMQQLLRLCRDWIQAVSRQTKRATTAAGAH